jgi:hypothetical protein
MNRKMGISSTNGITKSESKKDTTHGMSNGTGKRKADTSSDSEEDSKAKLVSKLSSKKSEFTELMNKKKKSSTESVPHKSIVQSVQNPSIGSPTKPVSPKLIASIGSNSDGPPVPSNPLPTKTPPILPLATATKHSELSALAEQRAVKENQENPTAETPKEAKNRLKKEKKKERKKLRKLGKLETST